MRGKGSTDGLKDVKEIFGKSGNIHPLLCPSAQVIQPQITANLNLPNFTLKCMALETSFKIVRQKKIICVWFEHLHLLF